MEFFKNSNIDFLGKKWYFIAFSLVFSVAGVCSMLFWHGVPLDIDFRGGTQVYVKFSHVPNDNAVRAAMDRVGLHNARIQRLGAVNSNEVLVDVPLEVATEQALEVPKQKIIDALQTNVPAGKLDLNNSSALAVASYLEGKDPLHVSTDAQKRYATIAQAITDFRDKTKGGVLAGFGDLNSIADPSVVTSLQDGFFVSDFGVYGVASVGPQVGKQLQNQAILATLYSLVGMLIYLAVRFEWIYGVAAVITVFHDTLITVGAFSLANKPISLTVTVSGKT